MAVDKRIIENEDDLDFGIDALIVIEPRFAPVVRDCGHPPVRRRAAGFAGLMDIIVSQQLSVAAAASIAARLKDLGIHDAETLTASDDDALRACGLSRQKIRYLRGLAMTDIDHDRLADLDDEGVIAELTKLDGIGRWSAEIYAAFCLGRRDAFPAGDLALRQSARMLFVLEDCPSDNQLRKIAEPWSPWRSIAARILWSNYRLQKQREGIR